MRLLAERGLYLGTRMPQLASLFAELWSARLADDVATERRRAIVQLTDAIKAERQATIDNFMADVATERRKAIAHMEDVLTSERQATIEEFMAQQKLIVTDALQQMNQTAETLVERILRQITILIALFLVGLTLANLLVGYILRRKSQNHQPAA